MLDTGTTLTHSEITVLSHHACDWADVYFRDDRITEVHLRAAYYNRGRVDGVIQDILRLSGHDNLLVLVVTHARSMVTPGGLSAVFAKDAVDYSMAKAYVFHNGLQFFLARLGRRLFRPKRPIRFFRSRGEAETWLHSLMGYGL